MKTVKCKSEHRCILIASQQKDINLFGDNPVVILVHVFEKFFKRGLLPHELLEAQLTVVILVHCGEELFHLLPSLVC